MLKNQINEMILRLGDIPDRCRHQVDIARNHYHKLIDKMDEYEWHDLLTTGVKIKDKEDASTFFTQIITPIRIYACNIIDDSNGVSLSINGTSNLSVLELYLLSKDIYLGPLGRRIKYGPDQKDFTNPISIRMDKVTKVISLVYV